VIALLLYLAFLLPYGLCQYLIVRQVLNGPMASSRSVPLLSLYMSFVMAFVTVTIGLVYWYSLAS